MKREFGTLAAYFWQFEPTPQERPRKITFANVGKLATTPSSVRLSTELRKRGWKFVGPTTAYAFMQAMGLVNDHLENCWVREQALRERAALQVPVVQTRKGSRFRAD